MRIIMTGGGTAGHINPALSIADHMKEKYPDTDILFIGTEKGLEKELVPKAGFDIKYIKATGISRSLSLKNLKVIPDLVIGSNQVKKIIKEFKPDLIIGTGGYVSFSTIREGYKQKIPTLIHESNSLIGLANKILFRKVDILAVSFQSIISEFKNRKNIMYTGNPLSKNILKYANNKDFESLYNDKIYKVLVTGGSQGARNINNAVRDLIISRYKNKEKIKYKLVFATGKNNYDNFIKELQDAKICIDDLEGIEIKSYIFNMGKEMSESHLMVGRCGAMTISEITAMGVPAILIPLPNTDKNYQELNARELEKNNVAKVILNSDLNGKILNDMINDMIFDRQKLKSMARASYKMGERNAMDNIEKIIMDITKNKK